MACWDGAYALELALCRDDGDPCALGLGLCTLCTAPSLLLPAYASCTSLATPSTAPNWRTPTPAQNTSTTNKQTTTPYDTNLHPNTTCAQLACPHSVVRELAANLCGALQRGGPGAQVPGVPGPALGPEPVCGEQLHGDPAAGGAPPAAASNDYAEHSIWQVLGALLHTAACFLAIGWKGELQLALGVLRQSFLLLH